MPQPLARAYLWDMPPTPGSIQTAPAAPSERPAPRPRVSIVVPTLNEESTLATVLRPLRSQADALGLERPDVQPGLLATLIADTIGDEHEEEAGDEPDAEDPDDATEAEDQGPTVPVAPVPDTTRDAPTERAREGSENTGAIGDSVLSRPRSPFGSGHRPS